MAPQRTTRIVVGQRVVCRKTSRVGQVLGIASPSEVCTIRYADTGEVQTAPAAEFRLASWDEMKDRAGDNTPTRMVQQLAPKDADAPESQPE